ncbi:MAG: tRNA (guanosine(46)-N7)-methyltransferase TrmB [Pseudomonadota bacterium]
MPGGAIDNRPWRNFHGRRKGKPLRPGHERLLAEALGPLALPDVGWDENPKRRPLDLGARFGSAPVWLEIGFGGGEHLRHQAAENPDVGLIGAEPFINGVAMLLAAIERAGLTNIALHPGDARDLLDVLPEAAITRVFLLYPDPWPKKRHRKRRFLQAGNLDALARVMAPGAHLRFATDIEDYVGHALEAIHAHPAFTWTAERAADWRTPWPDWPGTRYEAKALREGRRPHYLTFQRLERVS